MPKAPSAITVESDTGDTVRPVASQVQPATHHLYVIWLSGVAAIGGFLFGFDSGVINGAVDAIAVAFGTKTAATGFAVASVLLGCAGGAFAAGALANMIGGQPCCSTRCSYPAHSRPGLQDHAFHHGGLWAVRNRRAVCLRHLSRWLPRIYAAGSPRQQMAIAGLFGAFLGSNLLAKIAHGAGATLWLERLRGAGCSGWAIPSAAFNQFCLF